MCECVRACLCSCVRACVWVFTYIHTYSYKHITGNAGCWQTWTRTMWRRTSKPSRLSLSREHISRECGMCSPRCVAGRADHRGYPSPRVSSTTECSFKKECVLYGDTDLYPEVLLQNGFCVLWPSTEKVFSILLIVNRLLPLFGIVL